MIVNFVGNFQKGYVGEEADEVHLARELESLGHVVNRVPRDQWKGYCDDEEVQGDWNLPIPDADFNIIAKWPHFNNGKYIEILKQQSNAPVFYWVWDYMLDPEFADWHLAMAKEADLYLSGELGLATQYKNEGVRFYYFQMDVCDKDIPTGENQDKIHDVIFTGSYLGQGDRIEFLKAINKEVPVKVYSWNFEEWIKAGFEAYPAVYGIDYNVLISQSKIVLGLSVEAHCMGYWSNRVGKVLRAGGFLLQQYAPGMEQLMKYNTVFFSSPEEAVELIKMFLASPSFNKFEHQSFPLELTSGQKMLQLEILAERFIKEDKGRKWKLP